MTIRPVQRRDRDEWARMRVALYSNPSPREIDDWFDTAGIGGTHQVGVGSLVDDLVAVIREVTTGE